MAARAAATGAESCVSCVSKLKDAASRTGSVGLKSQEADCVVLGMGKPPMFRNWKFEVRSAEAISLDRLRDSLVSDIEATNSTFACVTQNAVAPCLEDRVPDSFLIKRRPQLLKRLMGLFFSPAVKIGENDRQRMIARPFHRFVVGGFFLQRLESLPLFRGQSSLTITDDLVILLDVFGADVYQI